MSKAVCSYSVLLCCTKNALILVISEVSTSYVYKLNKSKLNKIKAKQNSSEIGQNIVKFYVCLFCFFTFRMYFSPKLPEDCDWKMEKLRFHQEYPTIRSEAIGTTTSRIKSYISLNYKRNRKVRKILTRSKFEFDFRKLQSKCTSKDRTYLKQNLVSK